LEIYLFRSDPKLTLIPIPEPSIILSIVTALSSCDTPKLSLTSVVRLPKQEMLYNQNRSWSLYVTIRHLMTENIMRMPSLTILPSKRKRFNFIKSTSTVRMLMPLHMARIYLTGFCVLIVFIIPECRII